MKTQTIINSFAQALSDHKFQGLRVMIIGDETKPTLLKMQAIQSVLQQAEISCWAMSDLLPGIEREPFIRQGCSEATLVFILVTDQMETSGDHQKFIRKALSEKDALPFGTIYILPVIVDNVEVPFYLKELSPVFANSVKSISSLIPTFIAKSKSQNKLKNSVINW